MSLGRGEVPRGQPGLPLQGGHGACAQPSEAAGTTGDERLVVQLAPGPHRIDVRKDGYRAFSSDVNVRPGETAPLNVSLARSR